MRKILRRNCPYLKFAVFTTNQAILEAFAWLETGYAMAWPPYTPKIWPFQPNNTDVLQQVEWKLVQLAEIIGVEFEFRGFVANSLVDLDALVLDIRPSDIEVLAVNSVFELYRLLSRLGAIDKVLNSIKALRPKM
ncbi:hypothetical protein M9H77_08797 [Catharanthus roseus]|uniref:Uncharacterized protein n=1 Tax=Catharanthus roseus TaxID=4058 RepID=A0ACC0BZ21_CATRO|nr:hypothetical protein M9H77_08797 [Catharanthus roseus]